MLRALRNRLTSGRADEDGESDAPQDQPAWLSDSDQAEIRAEMAQLREFHQLAKSILSNSKGEALMTALRRGFEAAGKAQSDTGRLQQKALIFTESRRTQDYLFQVLQNTEFKDKVVLFNGVNNDDLSKRIYAAWVARHKGTDKITGSPSADMRQALVDHFRNDATIMIATEAAAEGVNLQFCNLVVNYDLPWNPQRIEQRIGRCHRYGQKFDVVVVNFLNRKNAADVRVYQLLREKFQLFDGVFGAAMTCSGQSKAASISRSGSPTSTRRAGRRSRSNSNSIELQKELETEIAMGKENAQQMLLSELRSGGDRAGPDRLEGDA